MATATKSAQMRFTISREQLIGGLAAVTPSTPAKATLPVLGDLLIESSARGVLLSGTDLDIFVRHEIAADVEGDGKMTVPAKRLLQIAKELPPAPVRVALTSDGQVTIDCGRSSYKLRTLPSDEFPMFPALDFAGPNAFTLRAGDLQTLNKRTGFAVSREESRPIINGVLLELKGDRLRFVATDGHRLALADQRIESTEADSLDLIIPTKALDQVARLFGDEDVLDIARAANHIGFRSTTTQIYSRLIEGPYPSYRQIIPKKHDRTMRVDRQAMMSSIRRMVPVAATVQRMQIDFISGRVKLAVSAPDVGEGHDEVIGTLEGDSIHMAANTAFLLDALGRLDGDEALIKSAGVDRAMLIESATKTEESYALYIVMPMRANG